MGKFKPKSKDELKEEVLKKYKLDYDDNQELVDNIVEDRFRDEEFKASEKNKTAKAKEKLNEMTKGKEFYKKGSKKPKGTDESKGTKISTEDRAYLYAKGYSRTELRHLEKVMGLTDKSWEKALNDNSFTSFKKDNDGVIQRRGSSLGTSRGGSKQMDGDHKEVVKEFSTDLPTGLAGQKKD